MSAGQTITLIHLLQEVRIPKNNNAHDTSDTADRWRAPVPRPLKMDVRTESNTLYQEQELRALLDKRRRKVREEEHKYVFEM